MKLTQERIEYLVDRFTVSVSVIGSMIVDLEDGASNYTDFEHFEDYGKVYIYDEDTGLGGDYDVDTGYDTLIHFLDELAIKNDKDIDEVIR